MFVLVYSRKTRPCITGHPVGARVVTFREKGVKIEIFVGQKVREDERFFFFFGNFINVKKKFFQIYINLNLTQM